jgi:hypothetical protein
LLNICGAKQEARTKQEARIKQEARTRKGQNKTPSISILDGVYHGRIKIMSRESRVIYYIRCDVCGETDEDGNTSFDLERMIIFPPTLVPLSLNAPGSISKTSASFSSRN